MLIGFINHSSSWGGGEKWHYEAAVDLQKRGYDIIFFCRPYSEIAKRLEAAGIATHALTVSNLSFLNPIKMLRLATTLRRLAVDALLLNSPADLKLGGPAARLAGIPNIVFRRGMPHPIGNNPLNRWLFRAVVHHVIANSRAVADSLDERGGGIVPSGKICIIENGVEFDDANPPAPLEVEVKAKLVISTAGRMVEQKNQRFLLDVAASLQHEGLGFLLIIAGTGKLENELKQAVTDLGLADAVLLPGFVKDIRSLLAITDIFCFPSLYEGSPSTLIEAAGHGLPIVASDIPPNREILPDQNCGRLVPLGDIDGFCAAIMELASDPTLRETMGAAARSRVRENYALESARQKLLALLENA